MLWRRLTRDRVSNSTWKHFYTQRWSVSPPAGDEVCWQSRYGSKMKQGKYWTGKYEHDSLYGHKAGVKSLKLLPSHGMLLTGSLDRTVRLWDLKYGMPLSISRPHGSTVRAVALDAQLVASGSSDNVVRLWHARNASEGASLLDPAAAAEAAALLEGGSALGLAEGLMEMDGPADTDPNDRLAAALAAAAAAAAAAGAAGVGSSSSSRAVGAGVGVASWGVPATHGPYSVVTGEADDTLFDLSLPAQQLRGHIGPVTSLCLTESCLYSGSWDYTVRCYRRGSWDCISVLKYQDWVWSVVARGGLLLVASGPEVHVHDLPTGKLVRKFQNLHEGSVSCLEGTHCARLLFSGGADGLLMAHDLRLKESSRVLWHHNAGKNPADDKDQEDSSWERSHGLCDDIFGAVYLAQTPHERELSVKKGVASSLIQSTQLLFLILSPYAGLFVPDENLWVYKYFSWVLVKIPVMEIKSYTVYVALTYVALGLVLLLMGLFGWMAFAIKNDEQERRKYRKVLNLVRPAAGLLFLVFPVAIMDLLSGVFTCDWAHLDNPVALLWPDVGSCFEGQHKIHAAVAAVTFVLYAVVSIMMGVGTCEQNPASVHMSSSPNLDVRCKITSLKVLLVLAASQLTSQHKLQAALCMVMSSWAFVMNFRQAPYYRKQTTSLHCGLWLGMSYLAALGLAGAVLVDRGEPEDAVKLRLTWVSPSVIGGAGGGGAVLIDQGQSEDAAQLGIMWWAGVLIMPVGISGIIASRLRQQLLTRDLARLAAAPVGAKLHKIVPLQGRWHVELLARCVREGRDIDKGSFCQDSLDLAETVLAYGAARYGREDPFMLTLQASFSIFVHRDTAMARMQLQQVHSDKAGLLLAYAQFCCGEYLKASKDAAGQGGMLDLASFVEFARNYRSAVRAHRAALLTQRSFWRVLLKERVKYDDLEECLAALGKAELKATAVYRSTVRCDDLEECLAALGKAELKAAAVYRSMVRYDDLEECLAALGKAELKATAVYRRVLERYPSNAKLLKAYAKFLEEVAHDPWRANRYYSEAERQGSSDGAMNLASMIKTMEAAN
ncbi:hypothetical protein OEZ85_011161 [Tetradesmus obliquus]|uniref:TmcB/TmcC TPR repeats domain-containing protein n=1 Tax=Tetradesmus obliquus TaxID=3088 RepID=A0ABY8TPF4_TETOB|nr:hypothetical protein OEZ85_011161 [Tetradesmus obliquus]